MNPFDSMLTDTVFIEKPDGSRAGPFKTAINTKGGYSAILFVKVFEGEPGWSLVRPLPNGKEERYIITDTDYTPEFQGISASWTVKLRKLGQLPEPTRTQLPTTINISNSQGIQIGDHNSQHIANSLQGLIERIDASGASAGEKAEAKGIIRQLLDNRAVAAILGGSISVLLGLLG